MCNLQEETFFSDIQQMAPLVFREKMSERHLMGTDRYPIPTCKAFVKSVVVLFLPLYRVH